MFLASLVGCAASPVQPAEPRASESLLRSADLEADLDIVEHSYRALHPGLARYNTPAEIDALFAHTRDAFRHDQSLADAYVELTRLTAGIRCGHSFPNPANLPKATAAALFDRSRLPFLFDWYHGEMVVTRDFTGQLPAGSIVQSINGTPTKTMLTTLLPLARADGHNDAKRVAYLSDVGDGEHEGFDILAPLVFPSVFERGKPFWITAREPDGSTVVTALRPQTVAERVAAAPAPDESGASGPLWSLEWRDRIAYLPMRTWVTYHTKRDWQADVEAMMADVIAKDAPTLIVDLRGNEGGSDVGDIILAHLIDQPLRRGAMSRRVRFRSVPTELRANLDTWDPTFVDLGKDATAQPDGWFALPAEPGASEIVPKGPRYRGRVIVLVDATNSSATFQFALTVQQAKLGTIVGAPTGGNQRGINGGAFFFVQLPHTHLEVDLPLIGTFPDGDAPDQGVIPDVLIETTPADRAANRDPVMAAALNRARR
ncbi:MAG: S41 family peptidase [Kofleriaceae bacterium]